MRVVFPHDFSVDTPEAASVTGSVCLALQFCQASNASAVRPVTARGTLSAAGTLYAWF